jgi:dipeptidyl aminopeptidase/acylaminoacyl peptidase
MKSFQSSVLAISIATSAIAGSSAAYAQSDKPTAPEIVVTGPGTELGENYTPVPISTWAQRDAVINVEISPDGKHLLILKTEGSGNAAVNVMEIYSTADFSKPLRRLNAKPMELVAGRWVSDKHVYGTAWQKVRSSVKGPEDDVRSYKAFAYNLETNKFANAEGTYSIENVLPDEPDHVLISEGRAVADASGVDPIEAFRPRAYYRYNLNTGEKSLVLKGNDKNPSAEFDDKGNPRFSQGRNGDNLINYYRATGDGSWKELSEKVDMSKQENVYRLFGGFHGFAGIDGDNPNKGYLIDHFGEDKAGLYRFDFNTGQVGEKLYSNPDADIMGIQRHSMRWNGNRKVVAALYAGAKLERHWFDMEEKALFESLERKIQYAHQINITSRTREGNQMVVYNSGPKDPGSYWYVKDGKAVKLASVNPGVKSSDLNQVEFIKYPARDGLMIPAYVTYPKGKGPFPLVVIPHGGPAVNEIIDYDEWGQYLANAGYMVLQPQYRISTGWGKKHFDLGYKQHGLAMQDDKDDGALYLVKQGLVDKNRMAMFGWSYGGYAALVATQRENNIYQCAIAGAAVADPEKQYLGRRDPFAPKAIDDWSKHRGGTTVNPVKSIAKTNIPLLMIHGNFDRRVLYYHYTDYEAAAKKAGVKNIQFLTLTGADHFYNTLMYEHQNPLYTKMLDFLKKDCGPGGL